MLKLKLSAFWRATKNKLNLGLKRRGWLVWALPHTPEPSCTMEQAVDQEPVPGLRLAGNKSTRPRLSR